MNDLSFKNGSAPTHVIYHFPCYDGFTAAWVIRCALGDHPIEYIPANHGDSLPELPEDARVLMVDFTWPRQQLEVLRAGVDELIVLDHHKSAEAALEGLTYAHFNMERSGAGLALEWVQEEGLVVDQTVSGVVSLVEDRDLWRFWHRESKLFHEYLSSLPFEFERWDQAALILYSEPRVVRDIGRAILNWKERQFEALGDEIHEVYIGSRKVPAVNLAVTNLISQGLHYLLEHELSGDEPMVAAYSKRGDGMWMWNLRSRPGFDCSEVAVAMGGGGHPQAAGFRTACPPFFA